MTTLDTARSVAAGSEGLARALMDLAGLSALPVSEAYGVTFELTDAVRHLAQVLDLLAVEVVDRPKKAGIRVDAMGQQLYGPAGQVIEAAQIDFLMAAKALGTAAQFIAKALTPLSTLAETGLIDIPNENCEDQ